MRPTDVRFDVLVLKVERMLPDINTDDGNVTEEWILVGSGNNFKCLGRRVETLIKYGRLNIPSNTIKHTSQPHPDP